MSQFPVRQSAQCWSTQWSLLLCVSCHKLGFKQAGLVCPTLFSCLLSVVFTQASISNIAPRWRCFCISFGTKWPLNPELDSSFPCRTQDWVGMMDCPRAGFLLISPYSDSQFLQKPPSPAFSVSVFNWKILCTCLSNQKQGLKNRKSQSKHVASQLFTLALCMSLCTSFSPGTVQLVYW